MPEQTRSGGRSFSTHSTARLTQSVGVPSTEYQFSRTFCMRSGRLKVRACPDALCSRSGATTKTSASSDRAAARVLIPSEKMPSSLVTRMRVMALSGRPYPSEGGEGGSRWARHRPPSPPFGRGYAAFRRRPVDLDPRPKGGDGDRCLARDPPAHVRTEGLPL